MKRAELTAAVSDRLWAAWQTSAEDMGSRAAETLIDAGMLVEPGGAAELARLRAERHTTNEALSDAAEALRVQRDRIAALEAELLLANTRLGDVEMLAEHAAGKGNDFIDTVEVLDALGLDADGNPLPAVPPQAVPVEGEHYAATHHDYRIPRDLPEGGGRRG